MKCIIKIQDLQIIKNKYSRYVMYATTAICRRGVIAYSKTIINILMLSIMIAKTTHGHIRNCYLLVSLSAVYFAFSYLVYYLYNYFNHNYSYKCFPFLSNQIQQLYKMTQVLCSSKKKPRIKLKMY